MPIRFSHNWNGKLDWMIFSTIRKCKGDYYHKMEGKTRTNMLNGKSHCKGYVSAVRHFDRLIDVPIVVIETDTGMTYQKAMVLFKKFGVTEESPVDLIHEFREIKRSGER